MSAVGLSWYEVNRLPINQRCEVLAILLSPYAKEKTGELRKGSPQELLATIFRGQIPRSKIPYLVEILRSSNILINMSGGGRGKGPWFLKLPEGVLHAGQKDAIYAATIHVRARELVSDLGKEAIPDLIAALEKLR